MKGTLALTRIILLVLSTIFGVTLVQIAGELASPVTSLLGGLGGAAFGLLLLLIDWILRKSDLRSFNTVLVGLFFGYLMGLALWNSFAFVFTKSALLDHPAIVTGCKGAFMILALYLGVTFTVRSAEELYISIPFMRLKPTTSKKKDIVADASVLSDPRIIDLAATGLLDNRLLIPRFVLKDLQAQAESGDEGHRSRGRRALEFVKKLESLPHLEARYLDTDFPDVKDPMDKLIRLARFQDAQVLTADMNRIQMSAIEGVGIVNIHTLSNALKPLMQTGEKIEIKIQRKGKEPMQGVGYLDDGTMVVVNGGGEFLGETIVTQVLSVKHTSSGRMIFCNALVDGEEFTTRTLAGISHDFAGMKG